jgi:hypothetical protein
LAIFSDCGYFNKIFWLRSSNMEKESSIIYIFVDPSAAGNPYPTNRDKTEALFRALECDMLGENPAYKPTFLQQNDDENDLEEEQKKLIKEHMAKIKEIENKHFK